MPNTGKHQEVKSKQNLDGTFEFIVEDSDAVDTSEEQAERPAPVETGERASSRKLVFVGIASALLIGVVVTMYAVGSDDQELANPDGEPAGFRPYKASGNNVEVPANARSNEVPLEEPAEEADEAPPEERAEVVEPESELPEIEILEESDEEFVEADEIIGDGEILDGSEEEMLEAAQAAQQDSQGPEDVVQPVIRTENLDMEKISESVRSQIVNGVNPRQIKGIRNLSPNQLQQLQQNVEKERLQQGEGFEPEP